MTNVYNKPESTFICGTRSSFMEHLREHPNSRRVSEAEKNNILGWLRDVSKRPTCQKDFNRRNYVQRSFSWNEITQSLVATAKSSQENDRLVVTEDKIFETVEPVHLQNQHAGWDATWKIISCTYYGILRSDMIFLLKRCEFCSRNPNRRPKRPATSAAQSSYTYEREALDNRESIEGRGVVISDLSCSYVLDNDLFALDEERVPGRSR
ncbi:hypothetical protein F5Y16DRAFT_382986 [Xylariaceae sp. FL0255]|nr:hypothetical protein F5Y16DRAFT_382986 [Xylariaceae sp. FL0255]